MSKHLKETDLSTIDFNSNTLFDDGIHISMFAFDSRMRDYAGTATPTREVHRANNTNKSSDIRDKTRHNQFSQQKLIV